MVEPVEWIATRSVGEASRQGAIGRRSRIDEKIVSGRFWAGGSGGPPGGSPPRCWRAAEAFFGRV